MATILNPTPITPQVFSGMWIQNLNMFLPTEARPKGFIQARLLPYDGSTLLALGGKDVRTALPNNSEQTAAVLTSLIAEVKRQANKTAEPISITVMAQDPSKPVRAHVRFADNKHHVIADCFALAGTDSVFAGVFNSAMAEIARLAGLSVVV